MSATTELNEAELERFTTVDFVDRVAFVIEEHGEFVIDSVCGLWSGASFMERETYDMFGIKFTCHPWVASNSLPMIES